MAYTGRTVEEILAYVHRLDEVMECALDAVPITSEEFPVLLAHAVKLSHAGSRITSINDLLGGHRMELL